MTSLFKKLVWSYCRLKAKLQLFAGWCKRSRCVGTFVWFHVITDEQKQRQKAEKEFVWRRWRVVVSDLKFRETDKDGSDDAIPLCSLFPSQSAFCFFLFVQKLFSSAGWRTEKPTDPSTSKLSTQDQHQIWKTDFPVWTLTHPVPLGTQTSSWKHGGSWMNQSSLCQARWIILLQSSPFFSKTVSLFPAHFQTSSNVTCPTI